MGHALVLNATYEPICVVPVRRALLLVLMHKAVPVEASDVVLHSESLALCAPSVVRLTRYVRVPYRGPVPLTRRAVFVRDGGRCVYCGGVATSIDHVQPRSRVICRGYIPTQYLHQWGTKRLVLRSYAVVPHHWFGRPSTVRGVRGNERDGGRL